MQTELETQPAKTYECQWCQQQLKPGEYEMIRLDHMSVPRPFCKKHAEKVHAEEQRQAEEKEAAKAKKKEGK
jgi:hypothetical protein